MAVSMTPVKSRTAWCPVLPGTGNAKGNFKNLLLGTGNAQRIFRDVLPGTKKWKGIRKAGKIQGRRVTVTCCYGLDVYQVSQSLVLIHASLLPLIDTDTVI